MATQLILFTVRPEFEHGYNWAQVLTLVSNQAGFERWYWGFQVKNPNVIQLFVDWVSIDAYRQFQSSNAGALLTGKLDSLAEGPVRVCVARLSPHPAPAFEASATEVVFINNPFEDFEQSLGEFSEFLVRNPGQVGQSSLGEIEEDGATGRHLYLVVGWESVEAQKAMMACEEFKGKVGLVRDHCESLSLDYVRLTRS